MVLHNKSQQETTQNIAVWQSSFQEASFSNYILEQTFKHEIDCEILPK